jgi:hypothetical protein
MRGAHLLHHTFPGELILNINRVAETKWVKRHEFSLKMLNLARQPMPR